MEQQRGGPFIVVVVSYRELHRRPLDKPIVIGRSMDCDLVLGDTILSRHHCRLEPARAGDGWAVVDLNSRNGTFVNANRVKERQALLNGDVVTVGRAHITFHASGYEPPREPRPLAVPIPRDPNADTMAPGDSKAGIKPYTRTPPKPMPESNE